ncbi:uncharacterized protein LOC143919199 [Arctopsyche grandis]|uniref:uncharacterized protein LOC143919199 n=1 Tax=Arctopsyche grandis TaxID=121162 RepID=UPI00406DA009
MQQQLEVLLGAAETQGGAARRAHLEHQRRGGGVTRVLLCPHDAQLPPHSRHVLVLELELVLVLVLVLRPHATRRPRSSNTPAHTHTPTVTLTAAQLQRYRLTSLAYLLALPSMTIYNFSITHVYEKSKRCL